MAMPRVRASVQVGGPMLNMVFQAAFNGDLPLFKTLVMKLDKGRGRIKEAVEALRVEDVGELEGYGVLHVAASRGVQSLEVCRYLVEELGVDVNGVDKKGRTPLYFAILCEAVGVPKYLLVHGANPDKASHDGLSPLHAAAQSGDCEIVELLLAKGGYIDSVAFCGTPLHCAANEDNDGAMKILLNHNADCNKMVNGKTPLITAIDADSKKCMLLLIKAGADRQEALTYAAKRLHSENIISTDFSNCLQETSDAKFKVPDDVGERKIRAAGFKSVASYSFKIKEYFTAAANYSVAMVFDPEDAILFSNRSLCWLHMGDGGKALVDANECRKMRPDWSNACYRQGAALMLLKDYKGACERFLDGLKLDPGNTEIENALSGNTTHNLADCLGVLLGNGVLVPGRS